MKKLLFFFALTAILSLSAQESVLFQDDFNAEAPDATTFTNWTAYDVDGDGNNWEVTDIQSYIDGGPTAMNMSGLCIDSDSWEGSAFDPDNWIIMNAPVSITGDNPKLVFTVGTYQNDGSWIDDKYSVYITESNDLTEVMTATPVYTGLLSDVMTADQADGSASTYVHEFDLSAYDGMDIYVTFRHFDCPDQNSVLIDDVKITAENVGIEDLEALGFNSYPNPVNDVLNLKADSNITHVSIVNILGQEVVNFAPNAKQTSIDTSDFTNGIYMVKVEMGEVYGTYKIVKE